ncbi:MAG: glutaredoxin family protein [Terrimesophilobacter sp.]
MTAVELTIVGKPDCHLCDVASEVIERVRGELQPAVEVTVQKRSILDDPVLHERYKELIPVVLVNGTEHAHWRVDPAALRAAILEA